MYVYIWGLSVAGPLTGRHGLCVSKQFSSKLGVALQVDLVFGRVRVALEKCSHPVHHPVTRSGKPSSSAPRLSK